MNKQVVSYSIGTLRYLSNKALYEIISGENYTEETKRLANRVLNSRAH